MEDPSDSDVSYLDAPRKPKIKLRRLPRKRLPPVEDDNDDIPVNYKETWRRDEIWGVIDVECEYDLIIGRAGSAEAKEREAHSEWLNSTCWITKESQEREQQQREQQKHEQSSSAKPQKQIHRRLTSPPEALDMEENTELQLGGDASAQLGGDTSAASIATERIILILHGY
ncbi:hypothetical protein B0H11DRAFT_1921404 [Mycena galericulata]|nr:hypothetical protein B0H11DRAFT_1921404 [Mycena galericulata]